MAGDKAPRKLSTAHIHEIEDTNAQRHYAHSTLRTRANCLRAILSDLHKNHGAPKLEEEVHRHPGLRPRNVTVTSEEYSQIMNAAPPHIRLWLTLCSDLAIRSGTAARIGPEHYNEAREELRIVTKMGEKLTLPCTRSLIEQLDSCDMHSDISFVRQLQERNAKAGNGRPLKTNMPRTFQLDKQFRAILKRVGITRRLTPHDLRRTSAVAMYEVTHDVRDVQALLGHRSMASTVWYLDHDLRPVSRQMLELIKSPTRKEQNR